jgi:limonene-1,2-epoxide hydrolase
MDDHVSVVLRAIEHADLDTLKRVLHPYLHWTENGRTVRGRNAVLALLATRRHLPPPASVELRADQIYRWTAD